MNINEFALKLNNNKYKKETTINDELLAEELGFVIVHGYSDDLVIFKGAIDEEVGNYFGRIIHLNKNGVIEYCGEECKHYQLSIENSKQIESKYTNCWKFKTNIPHSVFNIIEDDISHIGIVFDIKNM